MGTIILLLMLMKDLTWWIHEKIGENIFLLVTIFLNLCQINLITRPKFLWNFLFGIKIIEKVYKKIFFNFAWFCIRKGEKYFHYVAKVNWSLQFWSNLYEGTSNSHWKLIFIHIKFNRIPWILWSWSIVISHDVLHFSF